MYWVPHTEGHIVQYVVPNHLSLFVRCQPLFAFLNNDFHLLFLSLVWYDLSASFVNLDSFLSFTFFSNFASQKKVKALAPIAPNWSNKKTLRVIFLSFISFIIVSPLIQIFFLWSSDNIFCFIVQVMFQMIYISCVQVCRGFHSFMHFVYCYAINGQ